MNIEQIPTSLSEEMASQNTQYIQGPKMDWTEDANLHKLVQRLEGGGRTPTQHSTLTHQESENKAQVCQSMGWEGSQDIPQHGRLGQKRQSKDYAGHTQRLEKAQV